MTTGPAVVADAAAIARLEECFRPGQRWSETSWAEEIAARDRLVLVVRESKEIVAVVSWRAEGEWLDLHRVIVAPSHRRRGLATELLTLGMAWGVRQGATFARLEVEQGNDEAMRVYERLGFATVARRSHYYGNDRHAVIMDALLAPEEETDE